MTPRPPHVVILGGGPDAERDVSLESSRCVRDALAASTRYTCERAIIGRITAGELASLTGDVLFPVLHGPFGEGGPMQDLLAADGRPFVGCGPGAARRAMDKVSTKLTAARIGIPTADACVLNVNDAACPLDLPVVLKPIHEGSSVGVHICRDPEGWREAFGAACDDIRAHPGRVYMVEEAVLGGSELTVGVLDRVALAPIRIVPAVEFYDYQAKYHRDDTLYDVDPVLPAGLKARLQDWSVALAQALDVRHLCRVDYLVDRSNNPSLLEVNTLPGFTTHSLLPKAAAHAGIAFPELCERLVDLALRDAGRR